ncbi:Mitochondrial import receptor subunit TOM40 [Musa troglodytarum]|uniref:Mitochondrial import receptor subunit TOM40 n=1 Tax=Musa troglodytarum TaxID=320322 RepID=A0A9E7F042_9LILI|nr:Mitochondrial import receptor subunit TOM40 [Musa troglodytarum]
MFSLETRGAHGKRKPPLNLSRCRSHAKPLPPSRRRAHTLTQRQFDFSPLGSSASHAAAPPPLAPPAVGLAVALPLKQDERTEAQKVDWLNLPCPVPFEEIQREALFEGLRFDFTKGINQKFSLSHSIFMGSMEMEVPSQSSDTIKVPTAHYEFGTNFLDPKLTNEPHFSQGMFSFDYKGKDYRTQFQIGNNAFYGANYIQSFHHIYPWVAKSFGLVNRGSLALVLLLGTVATGQVASTGIVALSYVQEVSEKVSLASDFMYNHLTQDATSSFGYDYILRQCRLRGKQDSNGVIAAFLEERLNMGVNFILSAEVDHRKKDYIFGFDGITGDLELSSLAAAAYNDPYLIIYGCQSLMDAESFDERMKGEH